MLSILFYRWLIIWITFLSQELVIGVFGGFVCPLAIFFSKISTFTNLLVVDFAFHCFLDRLNRGVNFWALVFIEYFW